MPFVAKLPDELEDGEALLKRRSKAAERKENWRSIYTDCYRYAMPVRETFNWYTPGQFKNSTLYDSTLQEATYTAANTMTALLFPSWMRWAELTPGGAIEEEDVTQEITEGLQEATRTFFNFLNHSNFATTINETALDLLVGTGAMTFNEGTDEQPFVFQGIPLSSIELEEGPNGTIETTFMQRKPLARNLLRMYENMDMLDLPDELQNQIAENPDQEVEIIQGEVFHPESRKYYGIVLHVKSKELIWRFNYGDTSPTIVARASKITGEIYGRGRIMLALSDARSLDKMQEYVLRHSALQLTPPMTGVSDGVLNPYTAVLSPNVVIPVASNDSGNPSLRALDIGGNFSIGHEIMDRLRDRVRRTLIGPEPSEGPVKSATEIGVNDRNRLWAMGSEFSRIQEELLSKIVTRGVSILQRKGLIPKFKINGQEVAVKFTSPFARSQDAEDILAFNNTLLAMSSMGEQAMANLVPTSFKIEEIPEWLARKTGLDMKLMMSETERKVQVQQTAQAGVQAVGLAQEAGVDIGEIANVAGGPG